MAAKKDPSKFLLKDYRFWDVYLNKSQGYLGRCVIWCKRKDARDLTEATVAEIDEFLKVVRELRSAVAKAFRADWFNYLFLGNGTRHLHCHFVPRYARPETFMGIKFEDKLYGDEYDHKLNFIPPERVLEAIRDKIKELL